MGGWLVSPEVSLSAVVRSLLGASIVATVVTQTVGLSCLIPLGRDRALLWAAGAGALVSLPLQAVAIPRYGALGAAGSVAGAELAVLLVELLALRVALRRWPVQQARPDPQPSNS